MGAPELATVLERALEFDAVDARAAGTIGFMPRILVQATLPHSRPQTHEFERVNGRHSLQMHAPPSVGLPYGSYPRLVMTWLCTQAVKTKSAEIELGPTFSHFMYQLGLSPIGGKRGTTHRLRNQLHRLFSTTIRWSYLDESRGHAGGRGYVIAGEHHLWWSPGDPAQGPGWRSRIVLSLDFFNEITRAPVPIDLRAHRLLQRSPLAIDIYTWLTYRMSYLRRSCCVPWPALRQQFGAEYARVRDFRRRFVNRLTSVLRVYPARVIDTNNGLLLYPSPPHVPFTSSDRTSLAPLHETLLWVDLRA